MILGYKLPLSYAQQNQPMPRPRPACWPATDAPHLPVRLNAENIGNREACSWLSAPTVLESGAAGLNLSPQGDLSEAAANLFAMLRELDKPIYSGIAVAPIPNTGLGVAINDRLSRAAVR